jgi:hypothetical protein
LIVTSFRAFSSPPWMMAQGAPRLSAYLSWAPRLFFGADIGGAQGRDHALIIGDAVAVEYGDDNRAGLAFFAELAEHRERRLQPRDADREAGRRHRLTHEARH